MPNVNKQVIPASAVWSLSLCSRMSMAIRTCSWPSSSGKPCWYSHSPNSNRIMTFCHRVSSLWLQIQTYKSYSWGGLIKGYLLSGCKLGQRAFVRNCNDSQRPHGGGKIIVKNYFRVRGHKKMPQEKREIFLIWWRDMDQIIFGLNIKNRYNTMGELMEDL